MKTIILGEHQGDGIRYEMYLSAPAGGLAQMIRNPEGNWVGYADYAALKAENERMRKKLEALDGDIVAFDEYLKELVHNERLRKAGDELARVAIPSYILDTKVKAIEAWNAAKESQP
jgi:hypothetical protein